MKKLLIGSAVVFLMSFAAGLATATQTSETITGSGPQTWIHYVYGTSDPIYTTSGEIYLSQQEGADNKLTNYYTGSIAFGGTLQSGYLFDIVAVRGPEDMSVYNITGISKDTCFFRAEGKHGMFPNPAQNNKKKPGFRVSGYEWCPDGESWVTQSVFFP